MILMTRVYAVSMGHKHKTGYYVQSQFSFVSKTSQYESQNRLARKALREHPSFVSCIQHWRNFSGCPHRTRKGKQIAIEMCGKRERQFVAGVHGPLRSGYLARSADFSQVRKNTLASP